MELDNTIVRTGPVPEIDDCLLKERTFPKPREPRGTAPWSCALARPTSKERFAVLVDPFMELLLHYARVFALVRSPRATSEPVVLASAASRNKPAAVAARHKLVAAVYPSSDRIGPSARHKAALILTAPGTTAFNEAYKVLPVKREHHKVLAIVATPLTRAQP